MYSAEEGCQQVVIANFTSISTTSLRIVCRRSSAYRHSVSRWRVFESSEEYVSTLGCTLFMVELLYSEGVAIINIADVLSY